LLCLVSGGVFLLAAPAWADICWEKTGTRKVPACDTVSQSDPTYTSCISQCETIKTLADDPNSVINRIYNAPFCDTYCASSTDANCMTTCNVPSTDLFAGECENLCLEDLESNLTAPPPPGIRIRYDMPKPDQTSTSSGTSYNWSGETLTDYAEAVDLYYRLSGGDASNNTFLQSLNTYFSGVGGPLRGKYANTEADGARYVTDLVSFITKQETSQESTAWLTANNYSSAQSYANARVECKVTECTAQDGCGVYCAGDSQCLEVCEAFSENAGASDCARYCDLELTNCSSYWKPAIKHKVYTSCDDDATPEDALDEDENDRETMLVVDWQEGEDHDTARYNSVSVNEDAMFYAGLMNQSTYDAGICIWSGGQGWRAADDFPDWVSGMQTGGAVVAVALASTGWGALAGIAISVGAEALVAMLDSSDGVWTPWDYISEQLPILSTLEQSTDWVDQGGYDSDTTSYYSTLKALDPTNALYTNEAPVPDSDEENYDENLARYSSKLCYRVPLVSGPPPCCKVLVGPASTPETRDIAQSASPDPIPDAYSTFYNPAVRVLFPAKPSSFVDLKWNYPANADGEPLTAMAYGIPATPGGQGILKDPARPTVDRIFEISMRSETPQRDICAVEIDSDGKFVRSVDCEARPMDMSLNWSLFPKLNGEGIGSTFEDPAVYFELNGQHVILHVNSGAEDCKNLFGAEFCAYKTTNQVNGFDPNNPYICVSGFSAMADDGKVRPVTPNQPLPPGAQAPTMPEGLCVVAPPPPCVEIQSPASYVTTHGFGAWPETEVGSSAKVKADGACSTGYKQVSAGAPTRMCARVNGVESKWEDVTNPCERIMCSEESLNSLVSTIEAGFATYWAEGEAETNPDSGVEYADGVHNASALNGVTCLDPNFTLRRDASNNPILPARTCNSDGTWSAYNTITSPCVPRVCVPYTDPDKHIEVASGANAGETVSGSCLAGFGTRTGSAPQVACVSDLQSGGQGKWDYTSTAACLPQCNPFKDASVTISETGWEGDKVTATCANGYITKTEYEKFQKQGYAASTAIVTSGYTAEATCSIKADGTGGEWLDVTKLCVPAPSCPATEYPYRYVDIVLVEGTDVTATGSIQDTSIPKTVIGGSDSVCYGAVTAQCTWSAGTAAPVWTYSGTCGQCASVDQSYSTTRLGNIRDNLGSDETCPPEPVDSDCHAQIKLPKAPEGTTTTQMREMCAGNNDETFRFECVRNSSTGGFYWKATGVCID
jgi:hypothetical protein